MLLSWHERSNSDTMHHTLFRGAIVVNDQADMCRLCVSVCVCVCVALQLALSALILLIVEQYIVPLLNNAVQPFTPDSAC